MHVRRSKRSADRRPFADIQDATRRHQAQHGCDAYAFEEGAALVELVTAHAPGRVLELGTALGFTACCLASAGPSIRVDTIERDPEHVVLARENIRAAGFDARIEVHRGDFVKVMSALEGSYDAAFFDGLEPKRDILLPLAELVRVGGVLVCGNLHLSRVSVRTLLAAEHAGTGRWRKIDAFEGGRTEVFRKLHAK